MSLFERLKASLVEMKAPLAFLIFLYATSEMFSEARLEGRAQDYAHQGLGSGFWWVVSLVAFSVFLLSVARKLRD